jgi:hypothetical protein
LSLGDRVKPINGSERSGGLAVEFSGVVKEPVGTVTVTNARTGASVDFQLQGGLRFDTENAMHAPWMLPTPTSEGTITLFNSSSERITLFPSIAAGGAEHAVPTMELGSHETQELRLRDLLAKVNAEGISAGSIMLRYSGPHRSLQPALLIGDKSTGILLASTFNALHQQLAPQQTTWVFPDVSLSLAGDKTPQDQPQINRFQPWLLLSNGTQSVTEPQIVASFGAESGHNAENITLGIAPLGPLETRVVDLSLFVDAELLAKSGSHFALSATHNGLPGDLGVMVFSTSAANDTAVKSPGALLPSGTVEFAYWDARRDIGVLPRLDNSSANAADGSATLFFRTPFGVDSYVVPALHVAGGGKQVLNLKQIVRSGIPDESGNVIPAGTAFGVLSIGDADPRPTNGAPAAGILTAECNHECEPTAGDALSMPTSTTTDSVLHFAVATTAPVAPQCGPPPCAIPTNFRQTSCSDAGGGVLHFEYRYDSSTGNLADLGGCTMGEIVTYPGGNPFHHPSPPFGTAGWDNPTIINFAASGGVQDNHFTPGAFVKPYSSAGVTATQFYRYKCACANGGNYVNIMGPISINRAVNANNNGSFRYNITKSGCSAKIDPLP